MELSNIVFILMLQKHDLRRSHWYDQIFVIVVPAGIVVVIGVVKKPTIMTITLINKVLVIRILFH